MTHALVTLQQPESEAAEAYRTLRTNLLFSQTTPIRTLLFTSPTDSRSKSIVAANIAVTLAQSGRKTLLVDCDLRQPQQADLWKIANEPGLSSSFPDSLTLPVQPSPVANLQILPAGARTLNPADLFSMPQMDIVLQQCMDWADMVILDAPPLTVTDSILLGGKTDGVVLVLQAGKSRREESQRAKAMLEKANIRCLGAVLS